MPGHEILGKKKACLPASCLWLYGVSLTVAIIISWPKIDYPGRSLQRFEAPMTLAHALGLLATVGGCAGRPPNFVIMLADDMGCGDWSRTGAPAETPHLDAMSRSDHGVWFQRAYSGNPICSPTRASLHTGRTPARSCITGVEQHILCHAGAGGCGGSEFGLGNATRKWNAAAAAAAAAAVSEEEAALLDSGAGIAQAGSPPPAAAAATSGYLSAFYGKWHLGSLSDRGVGSVDCYKRPHNVSACQLGYWAQGDGCCFGLDGHLDVSHPLHFGYDEFVATPECAASATTNCGCFFFPSPHNDTPCELGHYHQHGGPPFNECMQYYKGNVSADPFFLTTFRRMPTANAGGLDRIEGWHRTGLGETRL